MRSITLLSRRRGASPLDHELKSWLSHQQFLAVTKAAEADGRSVSEFVRHRLLSLPEVQAFLVDGNEAKPFWRVPPSTQ
ncbi:MAG: hypothetical protein AB1830_13015 [Pseudomonadota bacterium]